MTKDCTTMGKTHSTKKRVLILGARGMLGQELVRAFSDWDVLAWDRDECDITDAHVVERAVAKVSPSVVVNTAAYNAVDTAEKEPEVAHRVNGDAVGYLAKAAASIGATFVHYSTDYVFDGEKQEGYTEDDTPNPISVYGRSKLLGEQKLSTFNFQLSTWYLIRTSRLFGNAGSGKKSFIDFMLEKARTEEEIEVVDEEYSSPTYVKDLAERTREIIEQKQPAGIYHVTNHGACTWYGFAWEIFSARGGSAFGGKLPMIMPVSGDKFPRPAKRPQHSQLLNTKLPSLRPWQDALREYLHGLS